MFVVFFVQHRSYNVQMVFLMNDLKKKNADVDLCSVFTVLCILTFSQKKQKEIAYLSNRQKD